MWYTNWASDQPNSESDSCVIIGRDVGSGFQWSDKSCTNAFSFMCQLGKSLHINLCVISIFRKEQSIIKFYALDLFA